MIQTTPANETDEVLLARSVQGDRTAFAALMARHQPALYRFTLRTCHSPRDAEDALQDGLLAAWRGAGTYRGESSVRTWLFQIVVHACRRRYRRRKGEPDQIDGTDVVVRVAAAETSADARAAACEVGGALDAALAAMDAEVREVLLLRDVEGLSGEEVARVLGLTLPAMKSRLHRARLELKKRVEERLGHSVQEMLS